MGYYLDRNISTWIIQMVLLRYVCIFIKSICLFLVPPKLMIANLCIMHGRAFFVRKNNEIKKGKFTIRISVRLGFNTFLLSFVQLKSCLKIKCSALRLFKKKNFQAFKNLTS